jgi:hypothetical protein
VTIREVQASQTKETIQDALGIVESGPKHPEYEQAWEYLAICENPSIKKAMRSAMEQTFGPYPPPTGYTDGGEPHWSLAVMSKYLNIPEEELTTQSLEIQERWGERGGIVRTEDLNVVH